MEADREGQESQADSEVNNFHTSNEAVDDSGFENEEEDDLEERPLVTSRAGSSVGEVLGRAPKGLGCKKKPVKKCGTGRVRKPKPSTSTSRSRPARTRCGSPRRPTRKPISCKPRRPSTRGTKRGRPGSRTRSASGGKTSRASSASCSPVKKVKKIKKSKPNCPATKPDKKKSTTKKGGTKKC